MRLTRWHVVGGLLALGLLGFFVVVFGVVPIKASSGHWAVTRWFLEFAMGQSVATYSLGTEVPDLAEPALVLKGAGHYASACQPCHGAPGEPASVTARQTTPEPPYLPEEIHHWRPRELFYIVYHGVKFTAMPAWPSREREDEVWAMVAFLLVLPGLTPEEYERLATGIGEEPQGGGEPSGPGDAPDPLTEHCARCHGMEGLGRGTGAFPKLAGQSEAYLAASLRAYATGERHSGVMEPVATALEEEALDALARWYATRAPVAPTPPAPPLPVPEVRGSRADSVQPQPDVGTDPALLELGETIAVRGIPERKVPACLPCHGPDGRGADHPRNPRYPLLAGQYAEYLVLQLRLFEERKRGGSEYAHVMHPAASFLNAEQREAVAAWYASLAGPAGSGALR